VRRDPDRRARVDRFVLTPDDPSAEDRRDRSRVAARSLDYLEWSAVGVARHIEKLRTELPSKDEQEDRRCGNDQDDEAETDLEGFLDPTGDLVAGAPKGMMDAFTVAAPAGRIGQPSDIAPIAAFLATPEAGWINGQTILANNGGTV
jgi:enoyl-ACP reductase-like protein